ncbi:hypothetical protein L9F63_023355, partial [Diploptera punctata]
VFGLFIFVIEAKPTNLQETFFRAGVTNHVRLMHYAVQFYLQNFTFLTNVYSFGHIANLRRTIKVFVGKTNNEWMVMRRKFAADSFKNPTHLIVFRMGVLELAVPLSNLHFTQTHGHTLTSLFSLYTSSYYPLHED